MGAHAQVKYFRSVPLWDLVYMSPRTQLGEDAGKDTCVAMSERRLSKRSQRRLRLQVAQRLAGSTVSVSTKKPRIEPTTAFTDHGAEDGDDAEDQEPQREVEATADSIGEDRESCGDVEGAEDVEGRLSGDDNPSESGSSAGQHRVSDGELSVLLISARTRGISARTRAILARKRGVPVRGISARMIAAAMKI